MPAPSFPRTRESRGLCVGSELLVSRCLRGTSLDPRVRGDERMIQRQSTLAEQFLVVAFVHSAQERTANQIRARLRQRCSLRTGRCDDLANGFVASHRPPFARAIVQARVFLKGDASRRLRVRLAFSEDAIDSCERRDDPDCQIYPQRRVDLGIEPVEDEAPEKNLE